MFCAFYKRKENGYRAAKERDNRFLLRGPLDSCLTIKNMFVSESIFGVFVLILSFEKLIKNNTER